MTWRIGRKSRPASVIEVLLSRRPFLVDSFLEQACLRQRGQAPRQDVGRNAQAATELIKACQAETGVAQDQHAPRIPHHRQATTNGTGPSGIFLNVHCRMIVLSVSVCKCPHPGAQGDQ